jgi:hypothetical protein
MIYCVMVSLFCHTEALANRLKVKVVCGASKVITLAMNATKSVRIWDIIAIYAEDPARMKPSQAVGIRITSAKSVCECPSKNGRALSKRTKSSNFCGNPISHGKI